MYCCMHADTFSNTLTHMCAHTHLRLGEKSCHIDYVHLCAVSTSLDITKLLSKVHAPIYTPTISISEFPHMLTSDSNCQAFKTFPCYMQSCSFCYNFSITSKVDHLFISWLASQFLSSRNYFFVSFVFCF